MPNKYCKIRNESRGYRESCHWCYHQFWNKNHTDNITPFYLYASWRSMKNVQEKAFYIKMITGVTFPLLIYHDKENNNDNFFQIFS